VHRGAKFCSDVERDREWLLIWDVEVDCALRRIKSRNIALMRSDLRLVKVGMAVIILCYGLHGEDKRRLAWPGCVL
jgi:hypothetical protein